MAHQLSLCEWNVLQLGGGIEAGAVVEAGHLGDAGVELQYTPYKLRHIDILGLLEYIDDVVLFLLSRVDGEHGEKVKHHAIVE
jgi:hypothetical protein